MKKVLKTLLFGIVSIALVLFFTYTIKNSGTVYNVSYSDFMEMVEDGVVEKVVMNGETLQIHQYNSKDVYVTNYIEDSEFVTSMIQQDVEIEKQIPKDNTFLTVVLSILSWVIPCFLMFFLMSKLFSGMGKGGDNGINIFNAGKNKSKMYKEQNTGVKFADVAGQEEAKESLVEIIDYLHNAEKYQSIGAKLPKGALLVGPPGTGKTLLAKAVAGEAGVPFFHLSGSEFIEMFVGVGASRVRDLFEEAKNNAPCIIFIDEIDAIGKSRDAGAKSGGHDEREQTLNQLLAEMDGFDSSKAIVVLAATNRPEILDKALLRPGRFDRRIIVDKPDLKGRVDILNVHIKGVCIDETVNLTAIAQATAGASGADLANIINEAALRAVKFNRNAVSQEDLTESVELVFAGKEKKDRIMSEKERKIVAYHEVGHAVIAALQKNSSPVQKITIVPRTMGSLGYTLQVPEEEKFLYSKDDILNEIKTLIGGRCAEEKFFNIITTGASNDIEKVTDLARKLITIYGMSNEFDMVAFERIGNYYLDGEAIRNCSETTSSIIDKEMVKIVTQCHKEVREMIDNNVDLINEVALYLLEKENITGSEFMEIFRKYYPDDVKDDTTNKEESIETKSSKLYSSDNNFSLPKIKVDDESSNNIDEEKDVKQDETIQSEINIDSEIVENNFEEPSEPVEQNDSFGMFDEPITEEPSAPVLDDIPMPDFDFPFDDDTKNDSKKEDKNNDDSVPSDTNETSLDLKEDKNEEKVSSGFAAPAPLKKKKKSNKKKNNTPTEQPKDDKQSGMDVLMDSMKTNPEELAQKKKGGIYSNNQKKSSDDKEITEDDY